MKITIEIPKEFEEHYKKDRFKDSLMRLACDIHCMAGQYERERVAMLIEAFRNAEEARKEATKMTNGDRIRAMTDDEIETWFCCGRWCGNCRYLTASGCDFREWLKQEAEE